MSIANYLKACVFDYVLCLVAACTLGYINAGAFYVNDALQNNYVLIVGVCAVLLAVYFAAAYSKRTVIVGVAAELLLLVVGVFVAHAFSSQDAGFFADNEQNAVVFFVVLFICTGIVFALTRRRWMTRVFFALVVVDAAFVQFMYEHDYIVAMMILMVACGAIVVFRNYRNNIRTVSTTEISFAGAAGVGVVFSAVCLGLACLVFFGLIAPMHPQAQEFKPFTRYMNFEVVDMTGTGNQTQVDDPDRQSDQNNQRQEETQQEDEDNEDVDEDAGTSPLDSIRNTIFDVVENASTFVQESFNYMADNPWTIPLFILVVAAILASPFVIKRCLRARKFKRLTALPARDQVKEFFAFFEKRLKILKITKPASQTLSEFSDASVGVMAPFAMSEKNTLHATYGDLSNIYSKVAYSPAIPSEGELSKFHSFYRGFYGVFSEVGGKIKYFLFFRYFRI